MSLFFSKKLVINFKSARKQHNVINVMHLDEKMFKSREKMFKSREKMFKSNEKMFKSREKMFKSHEKDS